MRARLLKTASIVLLALCMGALASMIILDGIFTRAEAASIARAFEELDGRLSPPAPDAPRVADPGPAGVLAQQGAIGVLDAEGNGYLVVQIQPDGSLVRLGVVELDWLPGATPIVAAIITLLVALGAGLSITLPIVARVGALERVVAGFARESFGVRASERGKDEVASLARHFNQMAERVEGHVETQRALMHAVAHEVRTPLARARLATELVVEARDEADRARQVDRLRGALDDLESLADEVMYFTRASALDGIELEVLAVAALVGPLIEALPRPADVALEVDLPAELRVKGDRRLLRRVMSNLVENAMRHARSRVQVGALLVGPRLRVYVDDDGEGVPMGARARIFEPFVRLDDPGRGRGGFGLGLAIADRMARAQGGRALVEDAPLGGARFVLELPSSPPDEPGRKGRGSSGRVPLEA